MKVRGFMKDNLAATALVCLALCPVSGTAQSTRPVASVLSEAYRYIDAAASAKDITGYTSYDAPNFVTGTQGRISRVQAANIIGFQMKHAQWYKSKTSIRQIVVKNQGASVRTRVHQAFLITDQKPHGIREEFVFDLLSRDTWNKRNGRWLRVSSVPLAVKVTKDGKMIINK